MFIRSCGNCVLNGLLKSQHRRFHFPDRRVELSKIESEDVEYFRKLLPVTRVLTPLDKNDKETLRVYNTDWVKKYRGQSQLVLKPRTTQEVSKILAYCNQRKLAVCPQGGNTGLVGGNVPVYDEIVINMSLMNEIKGFDSNYGAASVEAGVILDQLGEYLKPLNHIPPLDLGASGSCQVGGNASTNAGGIRLLRYGNMHGNVLGMEVVLADGTVIDNMTTLRKDNTGYDLKQLFLGAEGTLGIITGLVLLCPPAPKAQHVALLSVESFEKCCRLANLAKQRLGEILSAIEFFDASCLNIVANHFMKKSPGLESSPFYLLLETSGSNENHDKEKVDQFLEYIMSMDDGGVVDGTVAQDSTQQELIWFYRDSIAEACVSTGKTYKYDISLPIERMYDPVTILQEKIKDHPELQVVGYGHLGDGNLHLNIIAPEFCDKYTDLFEPFVYELTSRHRGSISAEHGVGVMKPSVLHYSKSEVEISLMRTIKKTLDPHCILNPYKVIPDAIGEE